MLSALWGNVKYQFSFHLLTSFHIYWYFLHELLYNVLTGDFRCSIILSTLIGILLQEGFYLFHMYVYIWMWTHELLFYSMEFNPLLSLFILMLTLSSLVSPCFLWTCIYYSLSTLVLSSTTHFSRLILSCPSLS